MPLQLRLFGEHLAGETFFDHLERLRFEPYDQNEETLPSESSSAIASPV